MLRYWPAALAQDPAVRLAGDVIHVAISDRRSAPAAEPRVQVHRLQDFDQRVRLDRSPPVQRYEDALLGSCTALERARALELVSEACRSRRTTPLRLRAELLDRANQSDRRWLLGVLQDAADGVHSVLESVYLRRVERAHGLPRGDRQLPETTPQGKVYRDVRHSPWGVLVELDGLLGHEEWTDRSRDLTRDLLAAARGGDVTLRVGWQQCELEACQTAVSVGSVLQQRGWTGAPRACGPGCLVGHAPGTRDAG